MRRWKRELLDRMTKLEAVLGSFDLKLEPTAPLNRGQARVVVQADTKVANSTPLTVTVLVDGDGPTPCGSTTIYCDGRALVGTTKDLYYGRNTGTLTWEKSGRHLISAKYSGDHFYEAQTISNVVEVEAG